MFTLSYVVLLPKRCVKATTVWRSPFFAAPLVVLGLLVVVGQASISLFLWLVHWIVIELAAQKTCVFMNVGTGIKLVGPLDVNSPLCRGVDNFVRKRKPGDEAI